MAYQSLYRRYRPDKFSEIVGQPHVVKALQNAVRENRVGHAYLFSGPRGTGKTSTARIMAKALNCTDLGADGEPCNACESCQAFIAGTSYDLHELDAASNNGVEAVRDLIAKVALGSPGRTKVYILDEVHMLTSGAENALLKTLEEPPEHVKFVLATTEPHKVVPTIRSRTQHLQFELISSAELSDHIRFIAADAGLDIDDEIVNHVVRDGGGSARDALSALDQVIAAGGSRGDDTSVIEIVEAIAASDSGRAIAAVDAALRAGREPRVIGEAVLARLRETFLAVVGADLGQLPEIDRDRALDLASRVGPARITRALEMLGTALVDMRQAPDPRVDLEVALVRLTRVDLDTDVAALVQRIEHLEQGATTPTQPPMPSRPENEASAAAATPTESPSPSPSPASPEAPTTRPPRSG
ncbi:MAG: DNA polymerase III subunit gamma/tau, partial [Acidimicrobiia bacterium]|nr:DNA polymerase III subunit gamma/tau [Acidimicrobiia bacterium]